MPRRGSHAVMVFPDWHEGSTDAQTTAARECALKVHRKLKPRRTVLLGDMLDCTAFSGHRKRSLPSAVELDWVENEVKPFRRVLEQIRANTKELVYIQGNHEQWVEAYCANVGGPMGGLFAEINPMKMLTDGLDVNWIPYVGELPHYKITDDLWAFHGWSHAKSAAEQHARMLKGRSGVHGHTHRHDTYVSRVPGEDRIQHVWSPGCLRTLQPDWCTSPTSWVHGFSLVYCRNDMRSWTAYTVLIDRGECILPDGTQVRV